MERSPDRPRRRSLVRPCGRRETAARARRAVARSSRAASPASGATLNPPTLAASSDGRPTRPTHRREGRTEPPAPARAMSPASRVIAEDSAERLSMRAPASVAVNGSPAWILGQQVVEAVAARGGRSDAGRAERGPGRGRARAGFPRAPPRVISPAGSMAHVIEARYGRHFTSGSRIAAPGAGADGRGRAGGGDRRWRDRRARFRRPRRGVRGCPRAGRSEAGAVRTGPWPSGQSGDGVHSRGSGTDPPGLLASGAPRADHRRCDRSGSPAPPRRGRLAPGDRGARRGRRPEPRRVASHPSSERIRCSRSKRCA